MIGLACVFFLYAVTPTIVDAPWAVIALMMLAWLVALVQGCRWFVSRPMRVFWMAAALTAAWFPIVYAGARWLDWA